MNIKCPECGQDHDVLDARIPADTFKASCRGCKSQFVVIIERCDQCDALIQQGQKCLHCKEIAAQQVVFDPEPEPLAEPSYNQMENVEQVKLHKTSVVSHQVQFSGKGGEFFRIWIVNLVLTIVTFGIYTPWAKVRTRGYFYNHTTLDDEPFEYLADPMILLRGYLLIAGCFLMYSFSQVVPVLSGIIMLIFYAVFPLLVFKSLRFYAHNSSFKNIRFRFLGSIREAYTTYLALPFAIPFTLGLIIPYWMYYKKRYFFENFAFGGTRNVFTAQAKPFYWIYFRAALMMVMPVCIVGVVAALVFPRLSGGNTGEGMQAFWVGIVVVAYLGIFLGATFVQQYVYAKTVNYCWEESDFGAVQFESTLVPSKLMLIQAVNILAIIFSAGLLYPWAKIRRTKYILENLTLHVANGLDDFTAVDAYEEEAFGEAAMDFFDFEIGL